MKRWQKIYGNLFTSSLLYWPILLLLKITVKNEYDTITAMVIALILVRINFKITPHPEFEDHYWAFEIRLRYQRS